MSGNAIGLSHSLYQYIVDVAARETDVMRRLREETAAMPEANMQVGANQGAFMRLLIQILDAKRCLEVGVFTGYSALCVASALPEDGQLIACDISDTWTKTAVDYWQEAGVASKIDLRLAPAHETLASLLANGEANTYDFAFIDADKGRYTTYYEQCLELLRPGGIIAVDNVLWSGQVLNPGPDDADTQAIVAFNEARKVDTRVDLSMVPVGDGLTLLRKR